MDSFKIDFLVAIGEVTEYTGLKLDYGDVATILNIVGITTSGGSSFSGGRGTAHFLSRAASQCHEEGDDESCELIRSITGIDDDDEDDDTDDEEGDNDDY